MTAVDNSNSVCKVGFAGFDTFCNRLNDTKNATHLTVCVAPFTISETQWLMAYCALQDVSPQWKCLNFDGNLSTAGDLERKTVNVTSLAVSEWRNLDIDSDQSTINQNNVLIETP